MTDWHKNAAKDYKKSEPMCMFGHRYNHRSVDCPLYKATLKHWGKEKNAPGLGDVHAYYAKHQLEIDKEYWAGIVPSEAVLECDDVGVGSGVRLFQRSTEERDRPQTSSKKPKPNSSYTIIRQVCRC